MIEFLDGWKEDQAVSCEVLLNGSAAAAIDFGIFRNRIKRQGNWAVVTINGEARIVISEACDVKIDFDRMRRPHITVVANDVGSPGSGVLSPERRRR
jgi:hypothetical protein